MPDDKTQKGESQLAPKPEPLTGDLIVVASDFATRVAQLQGKANIITPIVQISSLAAEHAVNLCVVKIDPTVDPNGNGPMCYRDKAFMKDDERGLGRIALDMIATAAGVSWLPHPHSKRTDDGRTPYVWAFTVVGAFTAMDGTVQTLPAGSSEVDLRDGSEQIGGWTPEKWRALKPDQKSINGWTEKRVRNARRFGLALAETKARLRAIRAIGIRQKYTLAELAKPFMIPRVSYKPDMSNPVVAETVTRMKMGGVAALYASQGAPALIEPSAADALNPGAAAANTPVHDEPVEGTVVRKPAAQPKDTFVITRVMRQPREGKEPLFFFMTKETGEEHFYTEDPFIAQAAKALKESGEPCDIVVATRDGAKWVEEIVAIRTGEIEDGDEAEDDDDAPGAGAAAKFVTDIKEFKGSGKRGPWNKRTIVLNTGETGVTFKDDLAKVADEAWKGKLPVSAIFEDNEQYPDQKNLVSLTVLDVRPAMPATEDL
jgi:hypothetical protein